MSESFENSIPTRELPNDLEAERKLLGCIFTDGADSLARCQSAGVSAATFYDTKHSAVFNAMLDLHGRQFAIEVHTIALELRQQKRLDELGGYPFLTGISESTPTTIDLNFCITTLRKLERRRELIRRSAQLVESCYGGESEKIAADFDRLTSVVDSRETSRTWTQAVDEAEAVTRERMKPPAQRSKVVGELSWGIHDFDRIFQPIELGELVVIGGYTSSGKSSLLRQVIWSLVMAGHAAMIETIETLDREEAINLAAHVAGIRSRARLHELHDKDRNELLSAFQKIRVPHFMVSHQEHSISAMFSRARAFKRTHKLRAMGTDYLQITEDVNAVRSSSDRAIAIARVTGASKQFATKEEIAMFLLSGFSRDYIKDGKREPILSDLEGGSAIEKDASRVLLLHIPTDYKIDGQTFSQSLTSDAFDQPNFYVKIIQAKGRNQGTASIGMMFHRETKTFHPLVRKSQSEETMI